MTPAGARTLLGSLAVAILAGCALQYPEAIYDPDDADSRFPGVHSMLGAGHLTRVLWIHGMCHHDGEWAAARIHRLADLVGGSYDVAAAAKPVTVPGTAVEVYSAEIAAPKGKVAVRMIVWSPLTVADKRSLCFDNTPTESARKVCSKDYPPSYPYKRAQLNDVLKTDIMNTCLSDAILYVGERGAVIRDALTRSVCFALGGESRSDGGCSVKEGRFGSDRDPLILVAESLGSKLLTDALLTLRQKPDDKRSLDTSLSNTRMIYLFANQIPILDLASTGSARALRDLGGLRSLVDSVRPLSARLDLADLFIVAFTDPNDVLSYRLPKDYFGSRPGVRVVNVISSNDETIAGRFENPVTAHRGYLAKSAAATAFVCGNLRDGASCPAPQADGSSSK